jgi:hypothetical protein
MSIHGSRLVSPQQISTNVHWQFGQLNSKDSHSGVAIAEVTPKMDHDAPRQTHGGVGESATLR